MLQISAQKKGGIWFAVARKENGKLIACAFSEETQAKAVKGVMGSIPKGLRSSCQAAPADQANFKELYELFMGLGRVGMNSFDMSHVSPFRMKVYSMLRRIPRGRVTTYGAIAKKIGSRRFARAVGTAVGSNPLPLIIPCHRVVTASLEVVNYGMPGRKPSEGAVVKRTLLEREGVKFLEGKVSRQSFWSPC